MRRTKILVICSAGAKRSNIMAFLLKGRGYDALAAGIDMNTPETIAYLCQWADRILLAQHSIWINRIQSEFHNKILPLEIGPDIWAERWPIELEYALQQMIEQYF